MLFSLSLWERAGVRASDRIHSGQKKSRHICRDFLIRIILELVRHTQRNNIIAAYAQFIIVVNLVDFIINKCGHIFVEVIGRADIDIFHQVFVTNPFDILAFRLDIAQRRAQAEIG